VRTGHRDRPDAEVGNDLERLLQVFGERRQTTFGLAGLSPDKRGGHVSKRLAISVVAVAVCIGAGSVAVGCYSGDSIVGTWKVTDAGAPPMAFTVAPTRSNSL
jgi:hypothetical protein